jgi:hypothetical protein
LASGQPPPASRARTRAISESLALPLVTTNAWAVGGTSNSSGNGDDKKLILRWNGKTWK